MLGSLARKLRIFGFDTLYFSEGRDSELEDLAKKEGRMVLTSDRALFYHSSKTQVRAILVEGRTDRARLLSIRRQAGAAIAYRIGGARASRCAVCNGNSKRSRRQMSRIASRARSWRGTDSSSGARRARGSTGGAGTGSA